MPPVLVAYLSGHGFGHFVRSGAVLSRIRGVKTHLRTNGRAFFLSRRADWAASTTEVDVGPGVVQRGPLATDLPGTRAALERHLADWPRLVDQEADFLRRSGARLVYGDIPPLAFAAAAAAGVPSVALGNFSWSWIYQGFAGDLFFAQVAARMREAETACTLLLELEMGGGLDHFPQRRSIAPVARALARTREQIRATEPLFQEKKERTFVLFSLGGFGSDLEVPLRGGDGRHRLLVSSARLKDPPPEAVMIDGEALPHHELVAAVDCVIGKPGYGTISECLRQPTPFCWLPRSDNPEGAPLVEAVERWLPSAPITLDDLASGRWSEIVDAAIAKKPRQPPPAPDGAAEAAAILEQLLLRGDA